MTHPQPVQPAGNPIVLACATNEAYAMPLAVVLASMATHRHWDGRPTVVYLVSTALSVGTKTRLQRAAAEPGTGVTVTFVQADADTLASYSSFGHLTPDALLRLFLPDLLPRTAYKVLYLDSDLCVRDDVAALFDLDVAPYAARGAIDPIVPTVSAPSGLPNWRELGLSDETPYINTGVLLMNLARWRAEGIGPTALRYVRDHEPIIRFADQDAINATLAGRIGPLDLTWNANVAELRFFNDWPDGELKRAVGPRLDELRRRPAICHYAGGPTKPWTPGNQVPFQAAWFYYLWRSRWFGPVGFVGWTAAWVVRHAVALVARKVVWIARRRNRST